MTEELSAFCREQVYPAYEQYLEYFSKWPSDPEEKPYDSLYKGRDFLVKLLDSIEALDKMADPLWGLLIASLRLQLGKNYIDCEEKDSGERQLKECLKLLSDKEPRPDEVVVLMQVHNQQGILWADRSEPDKALEHLLHAQTLYENYMGRARPPSPSLEDSVLRDPMSLRDNEKGWDSMESLHTHTLYYLAQVYTNTGDSEKGAKYCHATLKRQLESGQYDAIGWSLHCATLSQYYISNNHFAQARHCLASVDHVLAKWKDANQDKMAADEQLKEKYDQTIADVCCCWIKYCISILTVAVSHKKLTTEEETETAPDNSTNGKTKMEDLVEFQVEKQVEKFQQLSVDDLEARIAVDPPTNFEQARSYFLFAQEKVEHAKSFFVLDSYASNYAAIVQDHSSLFRLLASFEQEVDRKCKMQKRRIDMLGDIDNQLNPQHYLVVCRQLSFELGEAYYELAELKMTILEKIPPTRQSISKINRLLQSSSSNFHKFVESFSAKEIEYDVPEDYLYSFVMARLWEARIFTRFVSSGNEEEKANIRKALSLYQWIVKFTDKHEAIKPQIQSELDICCEMIELLPNKIALLK